MFITCIMILRHIISDQDNYQNHYWNHVILITELAPGNEPWPPAVAGEHSTTKLPMQSRTFTINVQLNGD